ncbi:MAG: hypothetical protein ACI4OD_03385 [Selenomonas sp.]
MDKLMFLALVLLPGFVAIKASGLIGTQWRRADKADMLFSYAAFSAATNCVILPVAMALGILPGGPMRVLWETATTEQLAAYLVTSTVISSAIGVTWARWLHDKVFQLANWDNRRKGRPMQHSEGLLECMFGDDTPHFVILQKDGKDIGVGFLIGIDHDTKAIQLADYPAYHMELHRARSGKPSYLSNQINTFYDPSTGLTIYETEYPPEWEPKGREQEQGA